MVQPTLAEIEKRLIEQTKGLPLGVQLALTDASRAPAFRGVHFARILRAAERLSERGRLDFDGVYISRAAPPAAPSRMMSTKYPRVRIDFSKSERPTKPGKRSVEAFEAFMRESASTESPAGGYVKIWPKIYIDGKTDPYLEMRIDADYHLSEGKSFEEVLRQRVKYNTAALEKDPNVPIAAHRRDMIGAYKAVLRAMGDAPAKKRSVKRSKRKAKVKGGSVLKAALRRDR